MGNNVSIRTTECWGTEHRRAYLWDPRATGVWRKHLHQGDSQEGETQGPEDVHHVVHDVRARTLKPKGSTERTY